MGEAEPQDLLFLHSVLAQCGLPYRTPPGGAREYQRQSGRATLIVQAGHLLDPATGRPVPQQLPAGARPRLLLLHLCSQALRRGSPIIALPGSMSGLMHELGIAVTGGRSGTIRAFKDQLNRLAASRVQLLFAGIDKASMLNTSPISRVDVWFPPDRRQGALWPSQVQLSAEFFESLQRHAVPLDPRAIRALQHSSRGLDVYAWLSHRLPRVSASIGEPVSWRALQSQFGGELTALKAFKREFTKALRQVLAVYPQGKVEDEKGGLRLHRSPPAIGPRLTARSR